MNWRAIMQRVSKALMVPIVVLPVAALLIALGEFGPDFLAAAGNAIIVDYLPLLFAVGVAIGFTDSDGMAGFAAVVGHVVLVAVMAAINPGIELESGEFRPNEMSVLGGIIVGAYTSILYWRFRNIRFPEFLGFFSGKRFIPIATALVSVVAGIFFGYVWPPINNLIISLGDWVFASGQYGAFMYGFLNRLLIPTGLHHILQNLLLHVFGNFVTPEGALVTGELGRFYAGDTTAGLFSGGFYATMMFAIPAAALAIVHESKHKNRKKVAGVMLTAALTSVITGITEPVEFAFIFTAPILFIAHSLLTGGTLLVSYLLGIRHYGYALPMFFMNYHLSSNPWLIFPLGVVVAVIYYYVFRFIIRKFNYPTPGREAEQQDIKEQAPAAEDLSHIADRTVAALGGLTNLHQVDACLTRLRVTVHSPAQLDEEVLSQLPASGISRLGENNLQIVFGYSSEQIRDEIREQIGQAGIVPLLAPWPGEIIPLERFPDPVFADGLLGIGVGIMPSGNTTIAPCAGEIVKVFPGGHAVVLKSDQGLELLIHIGLNTVDLQGEGFTTLCGDGQVVQAGDELVRFDPKTIQAAGKTLHSALIITNKENLQAYTIISQGRASKGRPVIITHPDN